MISMNEAAASKYIAGGIALVSARNTYPHWISVAPSLSYALKRLSCKDTEYYMSML